MSNSITTIKINGETLILTEQPESLQRLVSILQTVEANIEQLTNELTIQQASKVELARMIAQEHTNNSTSRE